MTPGIMGYAAWSPAPEKESGTRLQQAGSKGPADGRRSERTEATGRGLGLQRGPEGTHPSYIDAAVPRGCKAGSFLSLVRAEFNHAVLGDSQKLQVAADGAVDFNLACSFECSDLLNTLDDVAHKPVILSVLEVLAKEKKKEEKTLVLGQAAVDLLPLLRGRCSFSVSVPLFPTPALPTNEDTTMLDVSVSVPEPLLPDDQVSQSNLLKVTLETAYSVPDVWVAASGSPCSYVAALQVPVTAEREQILMFSDGTLRMGGQREPLPRPKKWPAGPEFCLSSAQNIPESWIQEEAVDEEDGDLSTQEDKEFRLDVETNKKRVSWDTERRCLLDAGGVSCLKRRILKSRLWPVEVMRSLQSDLPKGGKGRKEKGDEEPQISFHGVAYVDLTPLLYPGATRIHGAYRLHPFYESDLQLKTNRNHSILHEAFQAPATQFKGPRTSSSIGSFKAPLSKAVKETKEPSKQSKPADSLTEEALVVNEEGQMFADSRTYIVLEIALEKPLVPKKAPEEVNKRVAELIHPRPALPPRLCGAERAVQDFHSQISSIAEHVLQQYQQQFGAPPPGPAPALDISSQEQRRAQLLGELNYSGKYFSFKEQLKYSVVRVVREKMLRSEAFREPEQLRAFLSQLYIFLVDEMHVALNKPLSVDAEVLQHPPPQLSCVQIRQFAREAEMNQDYALAKHYYLEQLAQDRSNAAHWFDFGSFCMLTSDLQKADECFRQAVSVQQTHLPSLLMCGILAEMNGHTEEAEAFLEGATCVEPSSGLSWTLFGLFHQGQGNSVQAEMAFLEASKLHAGGPQKKTPELQTEILQEARKGDNRGSGGPDERAETPPSTTIYMAAAEFLLEHHALQMAQRALSQELLCPQGGLSASYHLALARLHMLRGEYADAESGLQEALRKTVEDPDVWATHGHLHYLTGAAREAQKCYERTLLLARRACDTHLVYLRLGTIYLQGAEFQKARLTYLRACRASPSCLTWLGLGVACYRMGDLAEAEDALTEANLLNNNHPLVWAYLALVCLRTGRKLEAEQCYKYTVKLNLHNQELLQEIKGLQAQAGFGDPSFQTFPAPYGP
ncbi:cilia- and flagella-associated protein 70-like isoform X2 [Denticeps clupeoides]|uniref:cilia- and flagella-associated protein 70-like isoform X2 n=1 Tax=Denticeps clupeoides TaxID=299321 RepID=UPI0010A31E19|nr:cilia- and flagella-associated protein 70-like isoform X2 [Denticeps clupeoides]